MILEGFRTEIPSSLSLTPHDSESRAGGGDEDKPTRYAVRWAVNEPSSASVGPRRDPLGISELADIAHRIIIIRVRTPFIEVLVQKNGCHQNTNVAGRLTRMMLGERAEEPQVAGRK